MILIDLRGLHIGIDLKLVAVDAEFIIVGFWDDQGSLKKINIRVKLRKQNQTWSITYLSMIGNSDFLIKCH